MQEVPFEKNSLKKIELEFEKIYILLNICIPAKRAEPKKERTTKLINRKKYFVTVTAILIETLVFTKHKVDN